VTDDYAGIYCLDSSDNSKNKNIEISLDEGVISNGYIQNPHILLSNLKTAFKTLNHLPRELNFVFLGQNVLIRELTIQKSILANMNMYDFIKSQIGISIHFPFNEAAYYYHTKSESEESFQIIVFIIDKNLLEDYFDIFEKIGIKTINLNLLSSNINCLYNDEKNTILDNTMIVSLLDNNITIHILESNLTVFGINEECDQSNEAGICDRVTDFIEKIANYYQFNLRKGKQRINNIILVNLSKQIDEKVFNQSIADLKPDFKLIVLNMSDVNPDLDPSARHSNIAYISSIANKSNNNSKIDFKIDRPKRGLIFANYLFVLSVLIFALISMVYIPWTNMNQEIQTLEIERDSLLIQYEMLEDNIEHDVSFTNYQREYNLAFQALVAESVSPSCRLTDLLALSTSEVSVIEINIDDSDKTITLLVTASDDYYLYNYSIDIYETHGIITSVSSERWILLPPEITMIASGTMKVVIYYA